MKFMRNVCAWRDGEGSVKQPVADVGKKLGQENITHVETLQIPTR